jgi:hypothetical protein
MSNHAAASAPTDEPVNAGERVRGGEEEMGGWGGEGGDQGGRGGTVEVKCAGVEAV